MLIILLDLDSSKATAAAWINSHDYTFDEWGYDQGGAIFNQYNDFCGDNGGIPQSEIIDADGNVRWAQLGAVSGPGVLTAVLDQLV